MVEASNVSDDAKYVTEALNDLKTSFANANTNKGCNLETIKEISAKTNALRKKIVETF